MQANCKRTFPLKGTALALLVGVCAAAATAPTAVRAQNVRRPAGWTDATHGPNAKPNYARLFSLDRVHELRIVISAESFQQAQADLKAVTPAMPPGMPGRGGPGGGADAMAALMQAGIEACSGKPAATACSASGMEGTCADMLGGPLMCVPKAFGNMAQGGAPRLTTRDPMYVPVAVQHDGRTWTKVGMRYKGNSSLMAVNMGGGGKIPFRLNFDRYADDAPEIDDQRFYGFQELTFSSNFSDESQIREVLAGEVFRAGGVPAPRAAFYKVFVDSGAGPQYWGLYAMVEEPSDGAMLDTQFGGQGGNLYKPDGPGADWTKFDTEGFEKKTNAKQANFQDVSRAVEALHAPRTNPAAWRAGLEAAFDVDLFLKWLAINTAIENWDTYGVMSHNYYLYGDPAQKGRLRWIPWDNNMAFGVGPGFGRGGPGGREGFPPGPRGGFPAPPGGFRGGPAGPRAGMPGPPGMPGFGATTDVLHRQVASRWPLIQLLLSDDSYAARYRTHLAQAADRLLAPETIARRARQLHTLVAPAVVGPTGERPSHTTVTSADAFEKALDGPTGLLQTIERRRELVRTALAQNGRP